MELPSLKFNFLVDRVIHLPFLFRVGELSCRPATPLTYSREFSWDTVE